MSKKLLDVTYGYEVAIDMTGLVEEVIDKLPGENKDWEFDGERLIIRQKHDTCAEVWSQEATLEDPAEYDCELKDSIEDFNVEKAVLEGIHAVTVKVISVDTEVDDQSDWEFEEDGMDPDRDYEDSAIWDED